MLEEVPITTNVINWDGHIGIADSSPCNNFRMDGHVDEFKYFYRVLNSADKY